MVTIAIDPKKSRVRIHKIILHKLGDPKYIQLLVNPNNKHVAIKAVENAAPGDQVERITRIAMMSENSIELYSKVFMKKLCKLVDDFDPSCSYRLSGNIISAHNMAIFSLDTITPIGV